MQLEPIGHIRTPFTTKDACPIQPIYAAEAKGSIEILPEYAAGLKDIEGFSHLYLLYMFDRAGEIRLVRPTFLDGTPLLDIKPYVPEFDRIETATGGWTESVEWRPKPADRE